MTNLNHSIHKVKSIRATRFFPANYACVTVEILAGTETEIMMDLFFGRKPEDRAKASRFYFDNGGKAENVQRALCGREDMTEDDIEVLLMWRDPPSALEVI